ncbi:hypothetical protein [Chryseobacterium shigense]|uniref:Uncharacterized protein n=1 Tax=Chryseobacterium shigense TaxID=297244 RepID=A0A841N0T8_9FLAO|nr:hypothetical protein [Chryseobacterium shigense]MBB6370444.1 hypothetical protein [Chryseobacterium shigense]
MVKTYTSSQLYPNTHKRLISFINASYSIFSRSFLFTIEEFFAAFNVESKGYPTITGYFPHWELETKVIYS